LTVDTGSPATAIDSAGPGTLAEDPARDLERWTSARRLDLERLFDAHIPQPPAGQDPGRLIEAIRYSLLAPGKRLRPLLALAAAEALGADVRDEAVLMACAAVELVHCYSLIHDDLPPMDDDDFRRGKPSCHKAFSEATAILAGDALLTLAFEWLAQAGAQAGRVGDLLGAVAALARGAGLQGMVRGQARDLGEAAPETLADLERLHSEKTAALFRAALEIGAAAGRASPAAATALGGFGQRFGVAFQHADDLDDADHPAYAARARERVVALVDEATRGLAGPLGERARRLVAFAHALRQRAVDGAAQAAAQTRNGDGDGPGQSPG
jgi:geranylgeranyl pyrophosphate synthase